MIKNYIQLNGTVKRGFTLAEIVVVIAVVGILAAASIVYYRGTQQRAAVAVAKKDLVTAQDLVSLAETLDGAVPTALPADFKASGGVTVSLVASSTYRYGSMNEVQNGVLFFNTCNDLIAEGYGRGVNNGGQAEQYITACNVYNNPEIQVNSAWSPRNFNVSIAANTLTNLANSLNYNDSWRPNRTAQEQDFYNTWNTRFLAQGGRYPITSFWDPWCTGTCTWGVQKADLPAPDAGTGPGNYCIQAVHNRAPTTPYRITNINTTPEAGSC